MASRGWEHVTVEATRPRRSVVQATPSKYRAVKQTVDGLTFASKLESCRYAELVLLEKAGAISELGLQPVFPIVVNGVKVATYIADYRYLKPDGEIVIEDCKGYSTPVYRLKKRLIEALYGFRIYEVR